MEVIMASNAEIRSGLILGGQEKPDSLLMHKIRVGSSVQRLFTRYPHHIVDKEQTHLAVGNDHLHRSSHFSDSFSVNLSEEEYEGKILIHSQRLVVAFDTSFFAQLSETGTSSAAIDIRYGSIDESGSFRLPDEVEIKNFNAGANTLEGKSVYSFLDKSLTFVSGVDLIVTEDDKSKALLVRDDPGAKGLEVPVELNIYRELDIFEDKLKGQ
jgi:hypothetical protein